MNEEPDLCTKCGGEMRLMDWHRSGQPAHKCGEDCPGYGKGEHLLYGCVDCGARTASPVRERPGVRHVAS